MSSVNVNAMNQQLIRVRLRIKMQEALGLAEMLIKADISCLIEAEDDGSVWMVIRAPDPSYTTQPEEQHNGH